MKTDELEVNEDSIFNDGHTVVPVDEIRELLDEFVEFLKGD
jgi:hypothetical protein